MNVAQQYDLTGARIECATLYSPFLRMLHVPKRESRARSLPIAPKLDWVEVITKALQSGPCSVQELWGRCKTDKGNKQTFHTILSRMYKDGLVARYGDKQPYAYGAKPKQ